MDIPERLLRQARAQAALEGRRLKDLVNDALARILSDGTLLAGEEPPLPDRVETRQSGRFTLPVIRSKSPGAAAVSPEMLKAAESSEDEERHAAVFGR